MHFVNIGTIAVNHYILSSPSGYIVIDTGYAGGFERFLRGLKHHAIDLKDIKYVFLTHAHDDHAGFLGELLQATGATLIADAKAPERLLGGRNPRIGGCSTLLAKIFVSMMAIAGIGRHEFPPVDVREKALLWDGGRQFFKERGIPLQIIPLPGHTADSIGLLSEDGESFCGDAAMNGFPGKKRVIIWVEDLGQYRDSWEAMIKCKAKTVYPSHGRPFPAGDLVRFRDFAGKIRLR